MIPTWPIIAVNIAFIVWALLREKLSTKPSNKFKWLGIALIVFNIAAPLLLTILVFSMATGNYHR